MKYKLLIICLLIWCVTPVQAREYTLDEKIDLLYEAVPGKDAANLKKDLKLFIKGLMVYDSQAPAKRIKKIFTATKERYLRNYYLYSFFPDFSGQGQFNCVTGTALFAVIFDELGIPYHVVEVPQHVYMVAYPESHRIAVESTSERDGVYTWTEQTKQEAIGFLIAIDKVTQEEVRLKGSTAILEEFFYSNDELTFEELAGIHFMNRAIFLSDKKDYAGSLHCIDRARELYQGSFLDLLEGGILAYRIEEMDVSEITIVNYMTRYYGVVNEKPEQLRMLKNFDYVIGEALITRRDLPFVDSAEVIVNSNLKDTADRNLFLAVIEETKAVWHYNRGKMEESLMAASRSYELNPENKNVEDLLAATITFWLSDEEDEGMERLAVMIDSCLLRYPFLADAPRFINLEIAVYSVLVADYYLDNFVVEGELYLARMEKLMEHPDADLEDVSELLGEAYAQISTYHFRKGMYEEALKWIDRALEYDPESLTHSSRKEYILTKL